MGIEGREQLPVNSALNPFVFHTTSNQLPHHSQDIKMSALPKPKLRSLLHSKTKIDFVIALGAAFAVSLGYKYTVMEPRRKRWEEWSKNYNAEADLAPFLPSLPSGLH